MVKRRTNLAFRTHLAITAGRLTGWLLKLFGRSATTLPGKVALLLDKQLLIRLTAGQKVIAVTGTNGKTTSVSMLSAVFSANGFAVVTNKGGANLDSGLATALVQQIDLLQAQRPADPPVIIFEIDEAYFARLAGNLNPAVCLVTNITKDQADRFGCAEDVRDMIASGLIRCKASVILCADDLLSMSLKPQLKQAVYTFGSVGKRAGLAPDLEFKVNATDERSLELEFCQAGQVALVTLSLAGSYNAYNAAGALLAASVAGLSFKKAAGALAAVKAVPGRMERFSGETHAVCLILTKNPAGLTAALEFVRQTSDRGALLFVFAADIADGRDTTWLWDVPDDCFLLPVPTGVSGRRSKEMVRRLSDAGKNETELVQDADALAVLGRLADLSRAGSCTYVLTSYSELAGLRAALLRQYRPLV